MAYEGLLGKLGKDIFEGSGIGGAGVAKYMGTGAVIGGAGGATLSDDGLIAGAFRGALFGAAVGGGINLAPKGISAAFKNSGIKQWEVGLEKRLGEDASRIFKPTYEKANTPANKELMKQFVPGAKSAYTTTKNDKDFSLKVTENLAKDMSKLSQNDIQFLGDLGKTTGDGIKAFSSTNSSKQFDNWFTGNKKVFDDASLGDKLSMGGSFITKAGFDSAYNHIVKPTGSFISKVKSGDFKSINKYEGSAAAFSAYGAYESVDILDKASEGDIGGMMAGMGLLVGGKLAFSQGVNLIHANAFLKEKGMTWGGVTKGASGGYFAKKFESGVKQWTPEDEVRMGNLFNKGATI